MTHREIILQRRNETLQALCRDYLQRLRYMANKHGLSSWVDETLEANRRKECEATEKETMMLARLCNDERVARQDIPAILGKSYRQCMKDDDFERLRRLPHAGIFSKVNVLLYKETIKHGQKKK